MVASKYLITVAENRAKEFTGLCNILDDADLRDAITKTNEYVSALPKERNVVSLAGAAQGQK